MKEIWKDIEGYEGLYQVSNLGNVKRLAGVVLMKNGLTKTVRERILRPSKCGNMKYGGYQFVGLCKESNVTFKYIHRLVAEAFIPNPNNLPQVNHKDEDKTNNVVDNLEFCSALSNLTYNDRHKKVGEKLKGREPYNNKEVLQYTIDGEFVKKYASVVECGRCLGVSESSIRGCIYGKNQTIKGYIFKYADGGGRWDDDRLRKHKDRNNYLRRLKRAV